MMNKCQIFFLCFSIMSDLNYNYRQYLTHNALAIQKSNTLEQAITCCYCRECNNNTRNNISKTNVNNLYMTEPSDLQQNYAAQFKQQSQKASLTFLNM